MNYEDLLLSHETDFTGVRPITDQDKLMGKMGTFVLRAF